MAQDPVRIDPIRDASMYRVRCLVTLARLEGSFGKCAQVGHGNNPDIGAWDDPPKLEQGWPKAEPQKPQSKLVFGP